MKITSPRTIPAAKVGVPYVYAVQATTGVISGTGARAGTWHVNVRIKDVSTDETLTLTLKVTK